MAKKNTFSPVSSNVHFPSLEEEVISYWKDKKIFEKSISSRPENKTWTFLDGPPFITGLPHYGSLLSSIPKDLFPRYWTMKGYRVRRVWGWDCHGLPAENKVEIKLGLKSKKEIEGSVGVARFIDECKLYVKDVSGEWEWYVDHVGRWVDFHHAYKTMDLPYMETVMWVFKQMYEKGHIYKGLRVSLYCPHDATPISNFEVAMDVDNYKEVTEPTAVYKYQLKDEPDTYLLAWSTTPWNKLATPALAVNPTLQYVKVSQGKEKYILAKSTLKILQSEPKFTVLAEFVGKKLVGKEFIPHYSFYTVEPGKRAFIVVGGDFVTSTEGTGIVTLAVYGEEDLVVMQKENIQLVMHVDEVGMLKPEVPKWGGMYYLKVDRLVIEDLDRRGLIYRVDHFKHKVPTCWRCHTRLYYAPQDAWYVNVQNLKPSLKVTNVAVHWYPDHFKYGRYLKSLDSAPDWCISRNRYWGSPIPVWECECGERFVPGSIVELEKASGRNITDLHKPLIDEITVPCKKCGKVTHRVTEVLDSWIEAGSASFAERHFPFDKGLKLESFFPPDFIVEYTGQIRAWFYVLHVIATALYDTRAFENVVVTGVILGTDGRKMSKNYGNYPDPKEMLQKYGGDALRLYLMGSPVMHGEDILISEEQYRNQVKGILLLYWNVYNFFVTYASVDAWEPSRHMGTSANAMDRWILSRMFGNMSEMQKGYESFDTPEVVEQVWNFMRDLSLWYVRRVRDRVGPAVIGSADKNSAHQTLWTVLTEYSKAMAPLVPFVTESVYRNLTGGESVHLSDWPKVGEREFELENQMAQAMKLSSVIHSFRKAHSLKVRTPLKHLDYVGPTKLPKEIEDVVASETNVHSLVYRRKDDEYLLDKPSAIDANIDVNEGLARELVRNIQMLRKAKGCRIYQRISVQLPKEFEDFPQKILKKILNDTLAERATWGDSLRISTG